MRQEPPDRIGMYEKLYSNIIYIYILQYSYICRGENHKKHVMPQHDIALQRDLSVSGSLIKFQIYKYIPVPYYTKEVCFCRLNPLLCPAEGLSNLTTAAAHAMQSVSWSYNINVHNSLTF